MTDYSRGSAGDQPQDDGVPAQDLAFGQHAPGDVPVRSAEHGESGESGDRHDDQRDLGSGDPLDGGFGRPGPDGGSGSGFAPPDMPGGQPAGAPADKLLIGVNAGNEPPRPGFVPHHDDGFGSAPYGGAPAGGRPPSEEPYGWSSHQPPPPAGTPFGAAPPPPPHGRPPMPPGRPGFGTAAGFGGPGAGGTGPNWAPVPATPSSAGRRPGAGLLILVAVIVALVAGAAGAGIAVMAVDDRPESINLGGGSSSGTAVKNRPPDSVAGVAQRVLPSVVMIKVSSADGEGGAGTGFIVNGGYIITNNHVISSVTNGATMTVVYNDKKTSTGKVVGHDPNSDIAVVKPETTHSLPPLSLGDSDSIAVGDPVIAIGSPLGLQGSVTTGIVSSVNRPVPTQGEGGADSTVLNAIQTDAAINPGNSGGPLVDMKGSVIGINSAIATINPSGVDGQSGNIGVGFAIPSNKAKTVAQQLISTGKVRRAIIGIQMDINYQGDGVRIAQSTTQGDPVTKGGPADKAGLKPGDVITAIDGKPVEGRSDLIAMITSKSPGDKIKLTYQRGGKSTTVDITLGQAG